MYNQAWNIKNYRYVGDVSDAGGIYTTMPATRVMRE